MLEGNRRTDPVEPAVVEEDTGYYDFDETISRQGEVRRQALVERFVQEAEHLLANAERLGFEKIPPEMVTGAGQFFVGRSMFDRIEGYYLNAERTICLVHQWRCDPEGRTPGKTTRFISFQFPNSVENPASLGDEVMRGVRIRAICSLAQSYEHDAIGAFGFLTNEARNTVEKIVNEQSPKKSWQEWLLQTFSMPAYEGQTADYGHSLVRLQKFSNADILEMAQMLLTIGIRREG